MFRLGVRSRRASLALRDSFHPPVPGPQPPLFNPYPPDPQLLTTDIFIYPGFEFQVVGGLVTNFHLPSSSLLMLVSAFS